MERFWTALAIAGAFLLALLIVGVALLPLQLALRLYLDGLDASGELVLRIGPVRRAFPLGKAPSLAARRAQRSVARRSRAAAGAPGASAALRSLSPGAVMRLVLPAWRYLRRRIWCRQLRADAVIGGFDAAQTAILYGGAWALWGSVLAGVASVIRLSPRAAAFAPVPDYSQPALRVKIECILTLRVGHVMAASSLLLVSALRQRRWRSLLRLARLTRGKGVGRGVRASDSGPDENGHGKPQGNGGRQHGDR